MAVVKKPFVFQIVGYQNSGKTTTVVRLIKQLKKHNVNVVTIKHHGHGGKPDIVEKDSTMHCDAGALASIVEGEGRLLLQSEFTKFSLTKKIALSSFFQPDLILVEGHKRDKYPKVVIVRDSSDHHLINELTNISTILYWDEQVPGINGIKQFNINDNNWLEWITNYIIEQL